MRNTKVYSITMPPQLAKQAERLAKKENRTMSELMREALRRYQQQEEQRPSPAALRELSAAIALLRAEAKDKGLDKLNKREINAEITAARNEMREERVGRTVKRSGT